MAMPKSLSHNFVYGSSLSLTYASQIISSIILTMHYVSSFDGLIIYGWDVIDSSMIWNIHANGASLFLGLMFLHVGRSFYYNGSNKKNLWVSGVLILLISMGISFLSYVLPYSQMSYWSATVIINLLSVISIDLCILVWSGFVVSIYTVTRFYTLHFLLPLALAILVLGHLHLLHKTSSNSLLNSSANVSFFPFFNVKDSVIWSFFFFIYGFIFLILPYSLSDAENFILANPLVTPIHIKPEWYFLFAYAILWCIPNNVLSVLALSLSVVMPVVFVLSNSSVTIISLNIISASFILLTVLSSMPILTHYTLCSQVLSVLYFIYFLSIS